MSLIYDKQRETFVCFDLDAVEVNFFGSLIRAS